MAIEIRSEKLMSFADAARSLPHRPNVSTLHRWRLKGIKGIRLESILLGGRRFTSAEAVERFAVAVSAAANGERPPVRTPARRRRDIERAEKELGTFLETPPLARATE